MTVLELNVVKVAEPVDLRYFARLERLRLSGVVLQDLSHHECLPFLETLCELWLQRDSIRWMDRRIFKRLESCTLLKPVDPRPMVYTSMIRLPIQDPQTGAAPSLEASLGWRNESGMILIAIMSFKAKGLFK